MRCCIEIKHMSHGGQWKRSFKTSSNREHQRSYAFSISVKVDRKHVSRSITAKSRRASLVELIRKGRYTAASS